MNFVNLDEHLQRQEAAWRDLEKSSLELVNAIERLGKGLRMYGKELPNGLGKQEDD